MSNPQTPSSPTSPGAPLRNTQSNDVGYESDRDRDQLPRVASSILAHSSTATLYNIGDDRNFSPGFGDERDRSTQQCHHQIPPTILEGTGSTTPPLARTQSNAVNKAPPGIDVISVLDPASAGGGGPLVRITTQQRERQEAEARERARREALEASGESKQNEGVGSGGILKRFRSSSIRRPIKVLEPLRSGVVYGSNHDVDEKKGHIRSLSPVLSRKSLLLTPAAKEGLDYVDAISPDRKTLVAPENDVQDPKKRDVLASGNACEQCDLERQATLPEEPEYVYPDGGYGWVVLASCATLAGMAMGWGTTWGLVFDYLAKNDYKDANQTLLSTVGPFQALLGNGCAFFFGRMGDRYGFKLVLWASTFTFWFAIFISAFTTQLWQLILSYGILLGIGQGMAIPLFMSLPSQWFYKKRGMASGIAIGGAGLGGGIAAQIIQPLLTNLGFKKTLIIMSFINLFFYALATLLIRTRPTSPEARSGGRGPWIDKVVIRKSTFWALALSLLLAVSAYGLPWNYVPLWCSTYLPHLSSSEKAVPSTVLCLALVIGRALVGVVADHIGPLNTYILVFILSGITQYALWLTATSFGGILAYVIVYGLVAPGYIGILPQIVVQLFGPDNLATNVGLVLLFNCPGNFINGPMGNALFEVTGRTSFKWVIVVAGALQIVGGIVALWSRFKTDRKLLARV